MLEEIAKKGRAASYVLASAPTSQKNRALQEIIKELLHQKENVIAANKIDKEQAIKNKVDHALQKRLNLEGDKFDTLIAGLNDVLKVDDPVGKVSLATELDQGLNLFRVGCPVGCLLIIFESRPEAAVQIASLAIKSGNSIILKGGKEALKSNQALVNVFQTALKNAGLPADSVQLVSSREEIHHLLSLNKYIDLVIPRGSNALVRNIMDNTKIPVMGHADGICSVYLDKDADAKKAVDIAVDSKTQYTAVCNAMETLIVHEDLLNTIFPSVVEKLNSKNVIIHADEPSYKIISAMKDIKNLVKGKESDYSCEYLTLELAIKTVKNVEEAINHINTYGSQHTDAIVTENGDTAETFMQGVGSANAYHNASTRFADGYRYGFGAEVGVSTGRIHARGPVGLEGLMIYKYKLIGDGHIVADYGVGADQKKFTHKPIDLHFSRNVAIKCAIFGLGLLVGCGIQLLKR